MLFQILSNEDNIWRYIETRILVTDKMKQEWKERYLSGETARSIANDFPYFNENTISKHIRKMGISRGRGKSKKYLELEQIILKEYQEDKYATCTSLGKKYNICDRTISEWLIKNNIPIKNKQGYITHCNTDYFKQIDTPNKAYLLGFITADGAITGKKNQEASSCSIEIHEKDKDLLYFAQREINPNANIIECYYREKTNLKISFSSKEICQDLEKYGIVKNKSKIIEKVPYELIPKHLLPFYFRGLIDGDGSISKDGKISIYSGSLSYIQDVQRILVLEAKVKSLGIYKGTAYFISWGGLTDKQKLFDYLYSDLDATFYYNRKYQRLYKALHGNTEITE